MGFLTFLANFNWIGLVVSAVGLLMFFTYRRQKERDGEAKKTMLYLGVGLLALGIIVLMLKLPLQLAGVV